MPGNQCHLASSSDLPDRDDFKMACGRLHFNATHRISNTNFMTSFSKKGERDQVRHVSKAAFKAQESRKAGLIHKKSTDCLFLSPLSKVTSRWSQPFQRRRTGLWDEGFRSLYQLCLVILPENIFLWISTSPPVEWSNNTIRCVFLRDSGGSFETQKVFFF